MYMQNCSLHTKESKGTTRELQGSPYSFMYRSQTDYMLVEPPAVDSVDSVDCCSLVDSWMTLMPVSVNSFPHE